MLVAHSLNTPVLGTQRAQVFLLFHEAWRQDVDPLPEHRVPSPRYADHDGEARNDE